jgi:hypothetical protein
MCKTTTNWEKPDGVIGVKELEEQARFLEIGSGSKAPPEWHQADFRASAKVTVWN